MSQFEYMMVMVSLILALAIAQALRGLSEIVTSEKRYYRTFSGSRFTLSW